MNDVTIAIVPAPGHEGLVENGPFGERPPLLIRWLADHIDKGANNPWSPNDTDEYDYYFERALVLYAPGGPRLGMVRAMEAAFPRYAFAEISVWASEDARLVDMAGDTLADWEIPDLPINIVPQSDQSAAFALAHLLHQRGLASEVLVLPVTP